MSLSDLASLGTFLSGIAVILSFVFLALQLRQGNINQRALIQTGRNSRVIDVVYRRIDPHLAELSSRGDRGDTAMSPDDVRSYLRMNYATLLNFEDTYLQDRLGTIDPDAWKTSSMRLKHLMAAPGFRISWKKWRSNFPGAFGEVVDQLVAEARRSPWEEEAASWASDVAEELKLSAK